MLQCDGGKSVVCVVHRAATQNMESRHGARTHFLLPALTTLVQCFGAAINAWAKADNQYASAERAEALLDRLDDLFLARRTATGRERLSNIPYNVGESPSRAHELSPARPSVSY